jgi:hypothetical protein
MNEMQTETNDKGNGSLPFADLTPEEARELNEHLSALRAQKAEEQRLNALWAPLFDLLKPDAMHDTVREFRIRALAYGWQEDDELSAFCEALMAECGYEQKQIRGHGWGWFL